MGGWGLACCVGHDLVRDKYFQRFWYVDLVQLHLVNSDRKFKIWCKENFQYFTCGPCFAEAHILLKTLDKERQFAQEAKKGSFIYPI